MSPIHSLSLLAAFTALPLSLAATTQAVLLPGVCGPYPGVMQTNTGNGFSGDLGLRPAGTGLHIDTQIPKFGSIDTYARFRNPWQTLTLYNTTGEGQFTVAGYTIGCRDEDGLSLTYGERIPIKINTSEGGTLVMNGSAYGLTPEPYAYYIDGVRQPGVYIGVAGSVRWAWGLVNRTDVSSGRSTSYWIPRLLVPTDRTREPKLAANEVEGFLISLFP